MKPFSIIVPAYNEQELLAQNTGKLIDYADSLKVPYEVVIVSNGSTDGTEKLGVELAKRHPQVKFSAIPEKGVGRAFKQGIALVKYEHIIFLDADLSADLVFIKEADVLLDSNVIVLGSKIKGLQNRSLFRKMGSFVFYLSVLLLMGMRHVDYAPGAKAYQKGFLLMNLKYIDDFTSFVLNLAFIAAVRKEPVAEIPIACDDRRQSRFNLWQEAGSKYRGLLSLKLRQLFGRL